MTSANIRQGIVIFVFLTGFLGFGFASTRKQPPPQVMLWSWYAQDDFNTLADRAIGVAYLALSLDFGDGDQVTPSPRSIPVRIPSKMYRMAVIRVDSQFARRPAFNSRQLKLAVEMIAEIVELAHPQAVQIDFDAPRSAWPFYCKLLSEVRSRIGPDVFLSMTALVSWCDAADSWLT